MAKRAKISTRKTPPSFDCYPDDLIGGTADFSPLAFGCYWRCLCYQWSHGFVPDSRDKIMRITGATEQEMREVWDDLISKFTRVAVGKLQNERMEAERAKALERMSRRSSAAKTAANARWSTSCESHENAHTDRNANALRLGSRKEEGGRGKKEEGNGSSKRGSGGVAYSPAFLSFWAAFPTGRKKSKLPAWKAWQTHIDEVDEQLLGEFDFVGTVHERREQYLIRRAADYAMSAEGRGGFVKMPVTWLNGNCWEDSPEAWARPSGDSDDDPRGNLAVRNRLLQETDNGQE